MEKEPQGSATVYNDYERTMQGIAPEMKYNQETKSRTRRLKHY